MIKLKSSENAALCNQRKIAKIAFEGKNRAKKQKKKISNSVKKDKD